jgi:hypothetical protein
MMTATEYCSMSIESKRNFVLAVDVIERLCAEAISIYRRMSVANTTTEAGRAEYERYETALLVKRNEIFARQMEYHMQGVMITISTDDKGMPIRVRHPIGYVSLEAIAEQMRMADEKSSALPESDTTTLPPSRPRKAAVRMK